MFYLIKVSTFIRYLFMLKLVLQQSELVMDLKYFQNIFIRQLKYYFHRPYCEVNISCALELDYNL